jgi:hypothetical protein
LCCDRYFKMRHDLTLPLLMRYNSILAESTKRIMKRFSLIMIVFSMMTLVLSACGKGPLPPADKTPPNVIFVSPANGAQNIPVNSSVIITFSEAMDASSINGQTVIVSTGNSNVQGTVTYSGVTAIFKPTSNLNPKTIYTVAVDAGVKDLAGNAMGSSYGYIFITGADLDATPPRVVDIQPSNRKTDVSPNTVVIVVMFSEPMDPSTITQASIIIGNVNGNPNYTVTPFGTAAIINIKPPSALDPNNDYTVIVTTRVKDLAGNAMTDAFLANFRTGAVNDTNPPSVVSIIPASGGQTVSVNTPISVTFSKPMNVSTINLSTFIVSDGTSTIPGDIQYYGTNAVFTPSNPLTPSTIYTVIITNAAADLLNNPLSGYSWNFTTEPLASDGVPPQVLANYPTSTNVPVYSQIVALFSETMLVSSITPPAFSLTDSLTQTPVLGNIKTSGAIVFFTPTLPLAYNKTYTATITTAATDIAGNPLASIYSWSFTTEVGAAAQSIGSISFIPSTLAVNGTTTASATATSGLAVTFISLTPGVCTVSGTNGAAVTGVTAGTCTIAANQAGNANYNAAPQVTNNITVAAAAQSIGTISFTPLTLAVAGTTTASATATSGFAVTFTSLTTGVCTVSGTNGATVTGVTTGTCTIAANQAGNANYNAAPQVTNNITVAAAAQTIGTISFTPLTLAVTGTTTASATATSGLAVTFTSLTTGVCTVSGATVTGVIAGTCTIAANQAGNANYNPALQVTQNITVGAAAQTIGAISFTPPTLAVNGTTTASATATSGLAVIFSSLTDTVCTVSGTNGAAVTGVTAGTCTIAANQAGNANYNAAPQVTQNITVGAATQTITVGTHAPATAAYLSSFTVAATAPGGTVTYSSGSPSVCTNVGATFTMASGTGTCIVHYDQAGSSNYNAAAQVTENTAATKIDQTITVVTHAPATEAINLQFTVAATASSGLAVAYSSGNPSVCTNVGATFTMASDTGTCIVQYDQAGSSNYNAAPQVPENTTATP